jgi:phosphate transport system protein
VSDLRSSYHEEIDEVRSQIVRLAGSVIEAIPRATSILLDGDLEGAEYMISSDDEIDARSLDIEEECYRVMALQAPVAVDLRKLVSAVKIVAEIERSADLAVNICKAARRLYGHGLDPRLRGLITRMSEQAQGLYVAAVDAYVEADAAKAAAIDDMDSLLDDLQREFIQVIFESHAAGRIDLQVAVQLAVVARFYERIGDHAVNIGDRTQYIVSGWVPNPYPESDNDPPTFFTYVVAAVQSIDRR